MNNHKPAELQSYFEFNDAERAVRIKRFDTPQPWINYLSNGRFHAFISQAGGGFCWWRSPVVLRLTRYRQYHLPSDSPGFYVYLREDDGSIWSPTYRPCESPLDSWEAQHRPGYTVFLAEKNKLAAQLSYFVPPQFDALVWQLQLTNRDSKPKKLTSFAYVENSQLNWSAEPSWGYYVKLQLKTYFDPHSQSVNYLFHGGNPRADDVPLVYLASDHEVASYSGDRNGFVGDYRSERNPLGVEAGHAGNQTLQCGEPASVVANDLELAPGESLTVHYFLGVAPGALVDLPQAEAERNRVLSALRQEGAPRTQQDKQQAWYAEHFKAFQCRVPDPAAERQINTWNIVNSIVTGRYSRSVNAAAPGIRGIGFRDSCQDMLAIAYRRPEWATEMLRFLLSQQYRDGHTVHYAYPEEKQPPKTTVHSDNHLWLPLVVNAILSETGDFSLLDEQVPYLADDHRSEAGSGTVWQHLMDAVRFAESNRGAHGIPLTFSSDWNDIIGRFNRHGRGETVFAGMQYVLALRYLKQIAEASKKEDLAHLQDCLERQVKALLACAWDGSWWRRGFDDDGNPVGSQVCEAGKLFVNPQSWAVLSGIGTPEQQRAGMEAAHRELLTPVGLKLLSPSFASWSEPGQRSLTGYGPGCGENGAIFCHANTWAIIAQALLGNTERAFDYFQRLLPLNAMRTMGIERYRAEPYAWVSNIVGPDNERFGWANVEQITGTAPWMDVAATQYLLGIRPTVSGLLIDPCVPRVWQSFQVHRRYRGCQLTIEVDNSSGSGHGVKEMRLNGEALASSLLHPEQLLGRSEATLHVVL